MITKQKPPIHRHRFSYASLLTVALCLFTGACATVPKQPSPPRFIPIELGYAATRVNAGIYRHHAILTFRDRQFVSFYDPKGNVTIAYRDLPSEKWTVHHTDWHGHVQDAHNMISMGISTDGILHISYDHHTVPLRYRRTREPLEPATFGPLIPMTGKVEKQVTYPQFVNLHDGTLLFLYRDGVSGAGDLYINRYDVDKGAWQPLQHPLIACLQRCNPYWCRPAVGTDGSLQLAWCWRRHGGAETNRNLCFARSPDGGKTWQDSKGKPYQLPITPEAAEVIDPVGENNNLSNQDCSEVDSHNRMHIVYRKNDAAAVPQYYHQWWDGHAWQRTQFSQFTAPFIVKGGGTKRIPLSRPNLFFDANDTIHVLYRDLRQGSRPMMATAAAPRYDKWTHTTIYDIDTMLWESTYDLTRWRRDHVLDLYLQPADQGDHETVTDTGPQMVSVLEWRP